MVVATGNDLQPFPLEVDVLPAEPQRLEVRVQEPEWCVGSRT